MKAVPELVQHIRDEMSKVVVGQDELRNQCVIALLCRGHVLLEGVPGIAKTLTVKALSRLLAPGVSARAVHFRPDARRHRRNQRFEHGDQQLSVTSRARCSPTCCSSTK